jgi:hypothetical protein
MVADVNTPLGSSRRYSARGRAPSRFCSCRGAIWRSVRFGGAFIGRVCPDINLGLMAFGHRVKSFTA